LPCFIINHQSVSGLLRGQRTTITSFSVLEKLYHRFSYPKTVLTVVLAAQSCVIKMNRDPLQPYNWDLVIGLVSFSLSVCKRGLSCPSREACPIKDLLVRPILFPALFLSMELLGDLRPIKMIAKVLFMLFL